MVDSLAIFIIVLNKGGAILKISFFVDDWPMDLSKLLWRSDLSLAYSGRCGRERAFCTTRVSSASPRWFYHNINRRRYLVWLKWLIFIPFSGQMMVSLINPTRSFSRGWSFQMIICEMSVHQDDHLREAGPSGWSFERGRSIRMIIWKRWFHPDDNLQKAYKSKWSFSKGQYIQMIICKRPVQQDYHL